MDAATLFDQAADVAKGCKDIGDEERIALYAYYKQATVGSATKIAKPAFGGTKWVAWHALGNMNEEDAMYNYCSVVDQLSPGWRADMQEASDDIPLKQGRDIHTHFADALCEAQSHRDLEEKASQQFYALFNQATAGPVTGARPDKKEVVKRTKWDAWNALGSMSRDEAKQKYIALVEELAPGRYFASLIGASTELAPCNINGAASTDVGALFEEAAEEIKKHPDLKKEAQLRIYAHYKQATTGPATGSRPGMFDPVKRSKWDAHSELGQMSQEDAKKAYVAFVQELVPDWQPASTPSLEIEKDVETPSQVNMPISKTFSNIDCMFAEVACDAKEHPDLSKQVPLRLFALHNQATAGPATGARPSANDAARRAKWDAWNSLGSMTQQEAKAQYCAFIDLLLPGWHIETAPWGDKDDTMKRRISEIPGETVSQTSEETRSTRSGTLAVDIDALFTEAAAEVTKHPELGKQEQLQIYAHYKQATVGPATGSRPGMFDPVKRAKWDAWKELGSMNKEEAKLAYCGIVDKCVPGWRGFQPEPRSLMADTGATPSLPPPPTDTRPAQTSVNATTQSQVGQSSTRSAASSFDPDKITIAIPSVSARDGVQWYSIRVSQDGHESTVLRRYNQFHELNVKFGDSHRLFSTALFPPKLRSSPSGQKLEERRAALESWLRHALKHANAKGRWATPLSQFLTPAQPTQSMSMPGLSMTMSSNVA